jgi:polyisoprenoid-binding protein YceI
MILSKNVPHLLAAVVFAACGAPILSAQPRQIDTAHSRMTIHVYKAGALAAFGHDHEISAPIASGTVDAQAHKAELAVNTSTLRVEDPKASEKDRAEVQKNMLGSEVLDAQSYKEIRFHSTSAEAAGSGAWKVSGELSLHGASHPVSMEVREASGRYTGSCRLSLKMFGIAPISAAGGTIKVKDEIQIDFDIQLAR